MVRSRVSTLVAAAVSDALRRTRTWTVAGWTVFFVFGAAQVIVPARSDGAAGLSVFGAELLHALGRSAEAPAAGLPLAILAALLVALPVAGFALAHGPLAAHLNDRRLRVLALRCSRAELWFGRAVGDGMVLAGIALLAALVAVWTGERRAASLSMELTLGPGLGAGLLGGVYGLVFALGGHAVAVAGRGGRRWLIGGAAVLFGLVLLRDVAGLGLLSPFGHLGGLLSGQPGPVCAAVAALLVLAGGVGAAGWVLFRRVDL